MDSFDFFRQHKRKLTVSTHIAFGRDSRVVRALSVITATASSESAIVATHVLPNYCCDDFFGVWQTQQDRFVPPKLDLTSMPAVFHFPQSFLFLVLLVLSAPSTSALSMTNPHPPSSETNTADPSTSTASADARAPALRSTMPPAPRRTLTSRA